MSDIKLQPVPNILLAFTDTDNPDEWDTLSSIVRNYAREAVLRDRVDRPMYATRSPLGEGRILGMWPNSGIPHMLIEFARCVEVAHGIGVEGDRVEFRCMKDKKP